MDEEKTVEISKKEYERLLDSEKSLAALEAVGVTEWEGYREAKDLKDCWNAEG